MPAPRPMLMTPAPAADRLEDQPQEQQEEEEAEEAKAPVPPSWASAQRVVGRKVRPVRTVHQQPGDKPLRPAVAVEQAAQPQHQQRHTQTDRPFGRLLRQHTDILSSHIARFTYTAWRTKPPDSFNRRALRPRPALSMGPGCEENMNRLRAGDEADDLPEDQFGPSAGPTAHPRPTGRNS